MRKILYLDGLRGLAAYQVVFHHFILAFYPALFWAPGVRTHLPDGVEAFISGSPINIFYNGNFAVCIFFVLSGYVLSHKFFLHRDPAVLPESAAKRYIRLAAPVAFSVLCAYVFMRLSLFFNQQAAVPAGSDWLAGFWTFRPDFGNALHLAFIGTFFSKLSYLDYNPTLWTIGYEFMGSLLVFAFLGLFGTVKNRYPAYLAAIVYFFQTYYLAFVIGMLLSDLTADRHSVIGRSDRTKLIRSGLLVAGLFLGSYPSGRDAAGTMYGFLVTPFLDDPAVTYHILGASLVILVLLHSQRMQKTFSRRSLLFLGKISFSLYLLHFIILGSFTSYLFLVLQPLMSYAAAFSITFILSSILTFTLSYVAYLYVDMKSVRFAHLAYERVFRGNRALE